MSAIEHAGGSVYYQEAGTANPSSIVFVHGFCGDHTAFDTLYESFKSTHHVVSLDLPWHGSSDSAGDISYTNFAAAVAGVIDTVAPGGAIVVAHSMGAHVAIELAADRPDIVLGLALLDAAMALPEGFLDFFADRVTAFEGPNRLEAVQAHADGFFIPTDDAAIRQQISEQMVGSDPRLQIEGLKAIVSFLSGPGDELLSRLRCPILIVSASVLLSDIDRLHEALPNGVFAQVIGTGHYLQIFAADQVTAVLRQFISLYVPRTTGIGQVV